MALFFRNIVICYTRIKGRQYLNLLKNGKRLYINHVNSSLDTVQVQKEGCSYDGKVQEHSKEQEWNFGVVEISILSLSS